LEIYRLTKTGSWIATGFIRTLILGMTILLLGGCLGEESLAGNSGDAIQPITVCTSAVSPLQLPVWYAYENGLFEQYYLQAELIGLQNGSTAATAMISGEVDACQIAASNIVNAAVAGEELVLIGGLFDTHVYSLMVSPEITEAADLVGKSVAVTRPGTATETSLRVALQHLGLTPDEDVALISAGSHGDIMGP
jgi:NitT/TauT family transport system substrate-binding protein